MEHWIWPGLEHSSSVDCLVFPHIYAACPDSVPFVATIASGLTPFLPVNFRPLTDTLANHTGVMLHGQREDNSLYACPPSLGLGTRYMNPVRVY